MKIKEKIANKRIKNWEYYADKYNLLLDNENYEDLERAFDEIREQSFSQQKQEIVEELENLITEEILICHKENQPTSRLTSLIMKFKQKLTNYETNH